MKYALYLFIAIMVGFMLWVELSMKLPIIDGCLAKGYTKYECADPIIRAMAATQKEGK
jgi:hypothetical protein